MRSIPFLTLASAASTVNALEAIIEHHRPSSSGGYNATLQWGPCDPTIVEDSTITCGFFEIPLDYHDHSAGVGRIAVAKLNATGDRLGSIFFNPGGPGVSGLSVLSDYGPFISAVTGGSYDVVTWDPRGVGSLTVPGEISCFDNTNEYNAFWNGTIELSGIEVGGNFTNQEDIDALLAQAPVLQKKYEELGERCLRHATGKYLKYVGTAATVRDMVALADHLDGPEKLINYAGTSYGTILGEWFINMFPERVGRILLDGVVDPIAINTKESTSVFADELQDANKAYQGLVTACALAGPQGCALASAGQSSADVDQTVRALLRQAYDATRVNASSALVTSADIRMTLFNALYGADRWAAFANTTYPALVAGVQEETRDNADALSRRRSVRRHLTNETVSYGGPAILCSDSVDRRGTRMEDIFHNIVNSSRSDPLSLGTLWPVAYGYCPFWPVRAVERYQGPFNRTPKNNVLVASNIFDPVTPLAGAEVVAKLLGDNVRLVRQAGFGHTTIGSPSQCLNKIMFQYFANGTLPEDNYTVCAVDADFDIFAGVNTEAILAAMPSLETKS
ncbi:alpha/beta-hydrolase [Trametes elegans]|nr:alpha/beta-hydrolase [Trametes elegans]